MAREQLFHYLTGFPTWFHEEKRTKPLKPDYAEHALAEARFDRYGPIPCPEELDLGTFKLIEIAVDLDWPRPSSPRRVTKLVMRGPLDKTRDMVFVLRWDRITGKPTIITIWSNLKTDQHRTLKKDRYRAQELQEPPRK